MDSRRNRSVLQARRSRFEAKHTTAANQARRIICTFPSGGDSLPVKEGETAPPPPCLCDAVRRKGADDPDGRCVVRNAERGSSAHANAQSLPGGEMGINQFSAVILVNHCNRSAEHSEISGCVRPLQLWYGQRKRTSRFRVIFAGQRGRCT